MPVTTKGQVAIPGNVSEKFGIVSETDIDFQEENGRFYLVKTTQSKMANNFKKLRGIATVKMTTDEIMSLTREV